MATPIPWLCCPSAILPQLWKNAWGHCPFGRPICDQALTSWLMSWNCFNISTSLCFLMMPSILLSASSLSGYVDIGLVLLWIEILLYPFPPASSQGPLLLFWDWFALFSPKYIHLLKTECVSFCMTAAWSHDVYTCVLLFVQMNVVPSGVWKLLLRMNQTWEVYNFFLRSWLISLDFFRFSHDVKQRGTEFEGRPWNTFTGTPPINSNDVN